MANLSGRDARARRPSKRRCARVGIAAFAAIVFLFGVGWAGRAEALQPLAEFLRAVETGNRDQRIAVLAAMQQKADVLTALGRVLPAVSARGVYARNEFQAELNPSQFGVALPPGLSTTTLVIQPANQLDGYFQLDVPLVDVAGLERVHAADANARGAKISAAVTLIDVQKQVARTYYQLIGVDGVRRAAAVTQSAAEKNLALVKLRRDGGVATDVDVYRAVAEVERAKQSIADAELTAELARRTLTTLTGLAPDGEVGPQSNDELDELVEESALSSWEPADALPAIAVSVAQRHGAEASSTAAKLALLPTLAASFLEHLTNAPGFFSGHNSIWTLSVTAAWRLDVTAFGVIRSQEAALEMARTKEAAARQRAADQIHESWFRVHTGIAKSRAARAEAVAADAAVVAARKRSQEGAATSFELVQAERDAFSAQVARLSADADLRYARAALRLDAGRPVVTSSDGGTGTP